MEKTPRIQPTIITTEETVLCTNLLPPPRLTPTGKISHAKTRVYTQRYRKEWEQMPDFAGWLTSVPFQPTRAYCRYCKKNLHAHRLSLLKHTCTIKHQRAALVHEAEKKKKSAKRDIEEIETEDNPQMEEEEENEGEIEYIVERLDTDEDEAQEIKGETPEVDAEEEEEEKEDNDLCAQLQLSDGEPDMKKIKLSENIKCRDALAEAMAHVHSEYLEEETEDNVQMEVVVEEESANANDISMSTIINNTVEDNKEVLKELRENGKSVRHSEVKSEKKPAVNKVLQEDGKGNLVVTSLPLLGTAYQINTSSPSIQNTINVTQLPIAPTRTITLKGGKTLTLTGGNFQPGTQYVLSKINCQNKLPTLVMTDKKPIIALNHNDTDSTKAIQLNKVVQSPAIPSTSQQSPKKLVKSTIAKKLRISTHVMDTMKGNPISGLPVSLYRLMDGRWTLVNENITNPNGRCADLLDNAKLNCTSGRYKLHFDVDKYFNLRKLETMYPFIEIALDVKNSLGHYHIPLFLSPYGFSTFRGS